jgi:hypothetical protein
MEEYDPSVSANRWDGLIELQPQQLVQVAFLGAIAGAIAWVLTSLIYHAIMVPLYCSNASSVACGGSLGVAGGIAAVLAGIAGLLGLVRLSVFRPLLIVLGAVITLWGLSSWVGGLPWYQELAWSIMLTGLTYTAFAWLVRPRSFVVAAIIVFVAVVVARIVTLL